MPLNVELIQLTL